ncbi:MAG: Lrp/AsnC family transcriptional regulator [Candidatus Helarchaeota archaeon]
MVGNTRRSPKLDEIDRKILFFLQANSRIPYHQIGKELKIAASTVHNRVKKMIEKKVIRRFAAIVDPQKLGLSVSWVGINVEPGKLESVAKELAKYEEVQIIGASYGDHDILLQVMCRDAKELAEFIRHKIKPIPGVKDVPRMHSSIFTEIYKIVNWVPLKEGEKLGQK